MEGAGGLPSVRTNKRNFKPTAPIPDVVQEASQQVDQANQADTVDIEPAPAAEDSARGLPAKAAKEPDVEATPSPARGEKRRSWRQARAGNGPGKQLNKTVCA